MCRDKFGSMFIELDTGGFKEGFIKRFTLEYDYQIFRE